MDGQPVGRLDDHGGQIRASAGPMARGRHHEQVDDTGGPQQPEMFGPRQPARAGEDDPSAVERRRSAGDPPVVHAPTVAVDGVRIDEVSVPTASSTTTVQP